MSDDTPGDTVSTEPKTNGLFRTAADQSVGVIVSGFRAAITVLGCVVSVITLIAVLVVFTNVDLATLGDAVVAIGLGWVATILLWPLLTFAATMLVFLGTRLNPSMAATPPVDGPEASPSPSTLSLLNSLSDIALFASGIGGGWICGRLAKANSLWHVGGLVAFLIIFWSIALWTRSRQLCDGPPPRHTPFFICTAQLVGVTIGGISQYLLAI